MGMCVHGVIQSDDGEEGESAVFVAGMYGGFMWVGPERRRDRYSVYGASAKIGVREKVCRGSFDDEGSETCWVALWKTIA